MGFDLDAGLGGGHHGLRCRQGVHHDAGTEIAATLMRHFLPALAVAPLPSSVGMTTVASVLVATTRFSKAPAPGIARAAKAAVMLPSIAEATKEEDLMTRRVRADYETQRFQAPPAGRVEVDERRRA